MALIEKYLKSLLTEHDCVILPGFGGILVHYVKAGFDQSNLVYRPSSRKIAFNEVLRMDDGLLAYHLVIRERISREAANQLLATYVQSLWEAIRSKGFVAIQGIGSFTTNAEGRLLFTPDMTAASLPEWFGLDIVPAKVKSGFVPAEKKTESWIVDEEVAETEEEVSARVITRSRQWDLPYWASSAAVLVMVFGASWLFSGSNPGSLLSSLNPFDLIKSKKAHSSESRKPAASYTAVENAAGPVDEKVNEIKEPVVQPAEEEKTPAAPEVTPEPAPAVEKPVEKVVEKSTKKAEFKKRFYIITGAYAGDKYAKTRMGELKAMGFGDVQTIWNKDKGWIMVSAQSYPSSEAAHADLARVRKKVGDGVWVFKK